jgi:hypothetical protein
MDCGSFRDNHAAFIDNALDAVDLASMRAHRAECAACAEHDATIRRALLLFRNMPTIEPSADFSRRLNARLRATERSLAWSHAGMRGPSWTSFAWAASGVLAAGYILVATFGGPIGAGVSPVRSAELALAPVVVTAHVPPAHVDSAPVGPLRASPMASPAIVASVSMGMPVWPAALLAAQAPMHFAATEFQVVSLRH